MVPVRNCLCGFWIFSSGKRIRIRMRIHASKICGSVYQLFLCRFVPAAVPLFQNFSVMIHIQLIRNKIVFQKLFISGKPLISKDFFVRRSWYEPYRYWICSCCSKSDTVLNIAMCWGRETLPCSAGQSGPLTCSTLCCPVSLFLALLRNRNRNLSTVRTGTVTCPKVGTGTVNNS